MPDYQLYCFAQSGNSYRAALMLNLIGADWARFWPHAFGAGTAAMMILAVMTRASLGHTGRPLVVATTFPNTILLLGTPFPGQTTFVARPRIYLAAVNLGLGAVAGWDFQYQPAAAQPFVTIAQGTLTEAAPSFEDEYPLRIQRSTALNEQLAMVIGIPGGTVDQVVFSFTAEIFLSASNGWRE